ncbi:MAG: lysophospholipid acyltransferase family protein [Verrucomicrobiota bacterium]
MNRRIALPGKNHRIREVEVSGGERLQVACDRPGARLFFVSNHPTHSDAQIVMEAQRQMGVISSFMAAYDVFLRSRVMAWVLQRGGAFSVDRDGNDRQSMKTAIEILIRGQFALTIFPEGNVYLTNDRVRAFQEGAAFIAMKAQKELGATGSIYAVPVAIRVTRVTDQREAIRGQLARLAGEVGEHVDVGASFVEEVRRIGFAALDRNLRQRGYLHGPGEYPGESGIPGALEHCAVGIVEGLEAKMELTPKQGSGLSDRIRRIRGRVHQIRLDPERKADHAVAVGWADEAMTALRILSYSGDYLSGGATMDRVGESVEKLLEDTYSEMQAPVGDRHAFVEFGDPILLSRELGAFAEDGRGTLGRLTKQLECAIQQGIDRINKRNSHSGSQVF